MEHSDKNDLLTSDTEVKNEKSTTIELKKRQKPTGLPWFDEPYKATNGETAIWVAVITQAMMDALGRATNPESVYYKNEAIHWLGSNSKDFVHVCLLADLEPDYVRRKAKKALSCGVCWRAAPGKGKRYQERKTKINTQKPAQSETVKNITDLPKIIIGPWKQ